MKRLATAVFGTIAASAAVILTGGILVGCGVPEDSSPRLLNPTETSTTRDFAESSVIATEADVVTIYFDNDQGDLQLSETLRQANIPVIPEDVLSILLAGPTLQEAEEGFVSYLPTSDEVLNTRTEASVFVVNFKRGSRLEELSGPQMYLAAGQLVLSLVENSDIEGVLVEIDGSHVTLPSDKGDLNTPADREDYEDLLVLPLPLDNLLEPPFPPPDEA